MDVFTEHYRANGWGSRESVSGVGSTMEQTKAIRAALPRIVANYHVQTMLDIPCGDFSWMRTLDLSLDYSGADVVEDIVVGNRSSFGGEKRRFTKLDITTDPLPRVDLIFCRDCLFHFSFDDVFRALSNMSESGSELALITTNTAVEKNRNIVTGEWRPLNLQRLPFSLPAPICLVDELCPDPAHRDKHMGLWRISDIAVALRHKS